MLLEVRRCVSWCSGLSFRSIMIFSSLGFNFVCRSSLNLWFLSNSSIIFGPKHRPPIVLLSILPTQPQLFTILYYTILYTVHHYSSVVCSFWNIISVSYCCCYAVMLFCSQKLIMDCWPDLKSATKHQPNNQNPTNKATEYSLDRKPVRQIDK